MNGQWFPGQTVQFEGSPRNPWHPWESASDVLARLGLTTNLELCLDAGDSASLPSSSTTWDDTSGNNYDFIFGNDPASDSMDPTQNGTAGGLSSSEYLSFDGGDRLQYNTSNETWVENIHKDNAAFTLMTAVYLGDLTARQYLAITSQNTNEVGFEWRVEATSGTVFFIVAKGSGAAVLVKGHGSAAVAGKWLFLGVSIDEATGSGGGTIFSSEVVSDVFDATYTSPSAASATRPFLIGGRVGSNFLTSGSRMALLMGWSRALTEGEMTSVYAAMRGRLGA